MNKKIIAIIIGILLIIIGLLGWNYINKENNLDEQVLEDVTTVEETAKEIPAVEEEQTVAEEETKKVSEKPVVPAKSQAPRPSKKVIINLTEPTIEATPVLTESVTEEKELTNPYVDENGNIVVTDEIKPPVREKIKFRGVVYTIKTRLMDQVKQ